MREVAEPSPKGGLGRTNFRRDFARLLHSPSFRRLQGKTQLFPGETDFFRNRLTHSLEVAQVAKGIALKLNASIAAFRRDPINLDLVELAGLAHDLGHPPFGHNGEAALDECMRDCGGFEGNAQTLRILSRIEKKVYSDSVGDWCGISETGKDRRCGLNFTYRSLASVLKYDEKIPPERSNEADLVKGFYSTEENLVRQIKEHVGEPTNSRVKFKTIECYIMDLADDIAYSTYDLEDAMKGGFAHPLQLRSILAANRELVSRIREKVAKEIPGTSDGDVYQALHRILDIPSASRGSRKLSKDQARIEHELSGFDASIQMATHGRLRVTLTSFLINKFISGIKVKVGKGQDIKFSKVYLDKQIHLEIESLKRLNYELMIMSPRLKIVEWRGKELVKTIFETLDSPDGYLLFPEDYRRMHERLKSNEEKKRLVCDFIAGMTDRYAVEFYSRVKGAGASIFKPL